MTTSIHINARQQLTTLQLCVRAAYWVSRPVMSVRTCKVRGDHAGIEHMKREVRST